MLVIHDELRPRNDQIRAGVSAPSASSDFFWDHGVAWAFANAQRVELRLIQATNSVLPQVRMRRGDGVRACACACGEWVGGWGGWAGGLVGGRAGGWRVGGVLVRAGVRACWGACVRACGRTHAHAQITHARIMHARQHARTPASTHARTKARALERPARRVLRTSVYKLHRRIIPASAYATR